MPPIFLSPLSDAISRFTRGEIDAAALELFILQNNFETIILDEKLGIQQQHLSHIFDVLHFKNITFKDLDYLGEELINHIEILLKYSQSLSSITLISSNDQRIKNFVEVIVNSLLFNNELKEVHVKHGNSVEFSAEMKKKDLIEFFLLCNSKVPEIYKSSQPKVEKLTRLIKETYAKLLDYPQNPVIRGVFSADFITKELEPNFSRMMSILKQDEHFRDLYEKINQFLLNNLAQAIGSKEEDSNQWSYKDVIKIFPREEIYNSWFESMEYLKNGISNSERNEAEMADLDKQIKSSEKERSYDFEELLQEEIDLIKRKERAQINSGSAFPLIRQNSHAKFPQ